MAGIDTLDYPLPYPPEWNTGTVIEYKDSLRAKLRTVMPDGEPTHSTNISIPQLIRDHIPVRLKEIVKESELLKEKLIKLTAEEALLRELEAVVNRYTKDA